MEPKSTQSVADLSIMAAMAEASLDALITIDGDGDILEFGPAAENLFGYQRDEVIGRSVAEIVIPERLRDAHNQGMSRYHASGEGPVLNTRVEVPACRRDGSEFPAELTVVPLELAGRKMFTAFVRDISQQKEHEAKLEAARAQAEAASAAKSRFLAHMSHELRSPLNTVLGSAELMLDSALSDEQREYAEMVRSSGSALLGLINEVLNFSRLESGQVALREEAFDLRELVEQLVASAAMPAQRRGLDLVLCVNPAVPLQLRGDAGRLRQILSNLIDNAIKFTEQGGVMLDVDVIGKPDDTVNLRFVVDDTGVGIDDTEQERLFGEFAQADETDATATGGVGLGLAIVKRLADLMGAKLGVDSTPGEGSRFWLELQLPVLALAQPKPLHAARVMLISPSVLKQRALGKQLEAMGCLVQIRNELEDGDPQMLERYDHVLLDAAELDLETSQQKLLAAGVVPARVHLMSPRAIEAPAHWGKPLLEPLRLSALNAVLNGEAQAPVPVTRETTDVAAHILLAEDGPTNQLVISAMLQRAGYEVSVVADGQAAVAAVQSADYDLVLMDMRMPVMDGLEASRQLRQLSGAKGQLPILALTANALEEDVERCLAAGMNDHCAKPFERQVLLRKIRYLLDHAEPGVADCA